MPGGVGAPQAMTNLLRRLMDQTLERWLPIPGFEGRYEVSDQGRVKSLSRYVNSGNGAKRLIPQRILKSAKIRNGYIIICLGTIKAQAASTQYIHRLVLSAFVGPCPDGMECCHNNGDPSDNRLLNLRWDTPESNRSDAVLHLQLKIKKN